MKLCVALLKGSPTKDSTKTFSVSALKMYTETLDCSSVSPPLVMSGPASTVSELVIDNPAADGVDADLRPQVGDDGDHGRDEFLGGLVGDAVGGDGLGWTCRLDLHAAANAVA